LIAALQNGELGAAGLDVFAKEPLPQDSPLWDMDNVVITGHYSGGSATLQQRFIDVFVDNLKRYLDGEPLRNIIDKEHCY
jgi:phosphoglycerate dehydrogenase-like enzyme